MTAKTKPVFTSYDVAVVAVAAAFVATDWPASAMALHELAARIAASLRPARRVRKPKVTP